MFLGKATRQLALMLVLLVGSIALLYLSVLRNSYYEPTDEQRSRVGAAWRTKGITVAVVWPPSTDVTFPQGVQLAWEEVNGDKSSPLFGKIRLKRYDEGWDSSGRSGAAVAHRVVSDGDIVAVLGHEVSASAVPASLTYENNGLLFLTPGSTDPRLTEHGFHYTFRLTPSDHEIAAAMMKFAASRGWKRIGLLFARSPGGISIADQLISASADQKIDLAFTRSYLPYERPWEEMDFRSMIAEELSEQGSADIDTVMVCDQLPRGAKLVVDLRRMGVGLPLIASDKFDAGLLWDLAKISANNLYVASAVDPDATTAKFLSFKEKFHRRYGEDPGYESSQGYEAFHLLASAILESESAEPLIVATTIRDTTWEGLFGEYSFTQTGDIKGRHISIKQQMNDKFTTVPY